MNNQTPKEPPHQIAQHIKQELDTQAAQLDPRISKKLDTLRQEAVTAADEKNHHNPWWKIAYVPALATCLAAAFFITLSHNNPQSINNNALIPSHLPTEYETVLTNADLELMEEELEFYLWLEEEYKTG